MSHHATPPPNTDAINTNFIKSLVNNRVIWVVEEPKTFLIPISLVLRSAVKEANPKLPKQAMIMEQALAQLTKNDPQNWLIINPPQH